MSAPAESPAADAPASGGKKPLLLTVAALVVGLLVGAGAGGFAVGPALAKGIAPAASAAKHHAKTHDSADAAGDEDEAAAADEGDGDEKATKKEGKEGEGAESPVYTIDNLVLNPAASGGTRFLLLTIAFEMKDAAGVDVMKSRDAELRDQILVTLGGKTVEQLADMSMRDSLKAELKTATGTLLKKKKAVRRVYFPQFVIQ